VIKQKDSKISAYPPALKKIQPEASPTDQNDQQELQEIVDHKVPEE